MNSPKTHDAGDEDLEGRTGHLNTLQTRRKGGLKVERFFRTLAAPLRDFIRRPKGGEEALQPPDYSTMVLLTFLVNPVLGVLMCYLHRRAKRVYRRECTQLARAINGKSLQEVQEGGWLKAVQPSDVWYIALLACCHFIIGISVVITAVISLHNPAPAVAASPKNCLIYRQDIQTMCTKKIQTFHEYCLTKNTQYKKIVFPHGVCMSTNDSDNQHPAMENDYY